MNVSTQLAWLTIGEASELLDQRQITPLDLVEACLGRIEQLDSRLNCYITVLSDSAREAARRASNEMIQGRRSPLHGIPYALKDLFETQGVRTTAGSKFYQDYLPAQDAEVVERLRRAGAILLGKLNMHEIALGVTNVNPHYGPCANPWDLGRVAGGSSGGSAAALAAGLCFGALGTDTGGSIRIPASLCGIVGLKPTRGRVSLRGVIPLSWNLDHVGPMARCVRDVALLFQSIVGYDHHDPYSVDMRVDDYIGQLQAGLRGRRVAVAQDDFFTVKTDSQVWSAIQEAARVFSTLGAHVRWANFPHAEDAARANRLMTTSDAAAFHRERLASRPQDFGEDVRLRLQTGAANTSTDYALARHTQSLLRHEFTRFFDDFDLLITPTTPVTAPPMMLGPDAVEQAHLLTRFTSPFNLTGLPAISLPCGFTSEGLPIGLQIITRPWGEAALLQAAYAYEQATEWHLRHPQLA